PGPSLAAASGAARAAMALAGARPGPHLVSQHLCIGGQAEAADRQRLMGLGVTHVLNAARQLPNYHPEFFVYLKLDLIDNPDQPLAPHRAAAVGFLRHVEALGGRALVHCVAGCSRSVSLVLMHLMEAHGMWLRDALAHVRLHRPVACPNEGFRFELAMLEVRFLSTS
ncbi:unnamed protein product, partial [Phaeothamnion confervicola]